ncbi:MAG TPA: DUF6600 domain-containing protein [Vicinamibacterales bacterium]|nr:DUF6600 domain-containing protein [Vicinamibacterales bacterium]
MARLVLSLMIAVLASAAGAAAAYAQEDAPPAHISYVDGDATLERDGQVDASLLNMPLASGDRVRTTNGRVEILFGDGSTLHLDTDTTVDLESDALLRLLAGRVRLSIAGPGGGIAYRIDAPAGSIQITEPGEYRVALLQDVQVRLELAVLRGAADLFTDQGSTSVRAGERAYASAGLQPSYAYAYNSAAWDAFDQWSEARRDLRLGATTEYLPEAVQPYAPVFAQYGTWSYAAPYGYVWYPRVATGWRPYYHGRWITTAGFGWTWVGRDPFAWPTHHFGRWGFSAGLWFWIPGSHWGPAWVSWATAPGYVSWCPLGWDNRPVIQIINVNAHHHHPWHAWTVVPARSFGHGFVSSRAVAVDRLGGRPSFRPRPTPPSFRDVAVPRQRPVRVAGRRASLSASSSLDATAVRRGEPNYFTRGAQPAVPERSFPAAARPPRDPAGVLRNAETSRPRATRAVEAGTIRVPRAGMSASPRTDARPRMTAPSSAQERPAYRAVPRGAMPSTPRMDSMTSQQPRMSAPSSTPQRPAYRAVPRGAMPSAPRMDSMPSQPRMSAPSSAPQRPAYRAVPRGAMPSTPRMPSMPSQPRMSAPSSAPQRPAYRAVPRGAMPSAPSRPSMATPSRPSMGGPSRSGMSAPSSNRAVPRGGSRMSSPAPRSGGARPSRVSAPRSGNTHATSHRAGPSRGSAARATVRSSSSGHHSSASRASARPRGGQ